MQFPFLLFLLYLLPECCRIPNSVCVWWGALGLSAGAGPWGCKGRGLQLPKERHFAVLGSTGQLGCTGSVQQRGREPLMSALPDDSAAAALTAEPRWNVFMLQERHIYNFPELLAHFQEEIVLCVSCSWSQYVVVAAIKRIGGKEIPFALLPHALRFF